MFENPSPMSNVFTYSIGKKLIVALAGIFLILFLLVHLGINITLILFKTTKTFNIAAHFMGTNILIKIIEIVLFGGILLHILYTLIVQVQNWLARPVRYRIPNFAQLSFFSRFQIHTAAIIFVFIVIHMVNFYFKNRFGQTEEITYDGIKYISDLGALVIEKFKLSGFVILYISCFVFLLFHLLHGFQSAFQTLGLNHKSYTPFIKAIGVIYSVFVFAGFTSIPLVIYFTR
jgi:succinate dehydrogenase / fumarate reductase cytochrome b subunit